MPLKHGSRVVPIDTIVEVGADIQRKALIEALVDEVKIVGPDRLVPVFRVPRPDPHEDAAAVLPATTPPKGAVRTMPNVEPVRGLEPLAARLQLGIHRLPP